MAASKKGAFTIGLLMAVSFGVVLFLMFSEIFPGPAGIKVNGLDWADDLFNKLSKGSSYFIPKLKGENQKFMGRPFTATIKIQNAAEADQINKLFTQAGARVNVQGEALTIEGDLGQTMGVILRDSDDMFNNQGQKLMTLYGYDEKEVLKNWWTALSKMDRFFKKNLKIEEADLVSEISKKGLEPSFNFYKIESQRVVDRVGIMTFLLVFYVFYTMWWGYAIFYLFEGFGLTMKKAKVKKEV
jgi:hypothetical protein